MNFYNYGGYPNYAQIPPSIQPQYTPQMTQQAQQQQPATQPQVNLPTFNVRPVTSREKEIASQIDFFNQGTLMPNLAKGEIYLKRFNNQTGASDIFTFRAEQEQAAPDYASSKDIQELQEKISGLQSEIEKLKKRGKVVKGNDADAE